MTSLCPGRFLSNIPGVQPGNKASMIYTKTILLSVVIDNHLLMYLYRKWRRYFCLSNPDTRSSARPISERVV